MNYIAKIVIFIVTFIVIVSLNIVHRSLFTDTKDRILPTRQKSKLEQLLTLSQKDKEELLVNVTCGLSGYLSGNHQKVICYTLYGNDSAYWTGLSSSLGTIGTFYPGWTVRVYTDNLNNRYLLNLRERFDYLTLCDVRRVPSPYVTLTDYPPMMWRFFALGDRQIDILLFRDTDSEILQRELDAVTEWLASNKTLHVMRDHPEHGTAILGGLWGVKFTSRNRLIWTKIRDEMFKRSYKSTVQKNLDQALLRVLVWPLFKNNSLAHDSYTCTKFHGSRPFPTQRINKTFVGAAYFRFFNRYLNTECPKSCRPRNHRDWIYC